MIKSYIINLDRNPDRMQALAARFDALGLPYKRFPAFDGSTFSEGDFDAFTNARPMRDSGDSLSQKPRRWSKGSMGCFMSHYAVWQLAANSPDPYTAIFEDDVYLADAMRTILSSTDWIPADADIIHMEPTQNRVKMRTQPSGSVDGRQLHRVMPLKMEYTWPIGAAAVILKRETAQRLISLPLDSHVYADLFLFNVLESPVPTMETIYQITPAPCIQDKFAHDNPDNIVFKSNLAPDEFYIKLDPVKKLKQKSQSLLQVLRGCKRVGYAA